MIASDYRTKVPLFNFFWSCCRNTSINFLMPLKADCFINVFRRFIIRRCLYPSVFTLTRGLTSFVLTEKSQLPLKTGTRNKSKTNCSRKDASGCSNSLGLHTPVGRGKGWYAAFVQPWRLFNGPYWGRVDFKFQVAYSCFWLPKWLWTFNP